LKELIEWATDIVIPTLENDRFANNYTRNSNIFVVVMTVRVKMMASPKRERKTIQLQMSNQLKHNILGTLFYYQHIIYNIIREEFAYAIAELLAIVFSECVTFRLCSSETKINICSILKSMLDAATSSGILISYWI
jgi:hypothetical protein